MKQQKLSFDKAIERIAEEAQRRTETKVLVVSDEEDAKTRKALFLIFFEDGVMVKQLEGNAEKIATNWELVADELTGIILGRKVREATTIGEQLCLN